MNKLDNEAKKQKLISLAKELKFQLSDEQIDLILNEYNSIENSIKVLKDLNIDDVQPTSFVAPISFVNLNDDQYQEYEPAQVFKNSQYYQNGEVVINDKK